MNTTRSEPELLCVVNNRLCVDDTGAMALCIMTGTVTESFLVASIDAGPPNATYPIYKLTIAPFEQEFRCDNAVWGLKFKFHVISGSISPAGFSFVTRGEGKGESWRSCECP